LNAFFNDFQINSQLQTDFDKELETAKVIDARVIDLETKRRATADQISKNTEERNQMIEAANEFINQVKKDNESRAKTLIASIKFNTDKIKDLNDFKDDSKAFDESIIK
jgi:hypothetical protein